MCQVYLNKAGKKKLKCFYCVFFLKIKPPRRAVNILTLPPTTVKRMMGLLSVSRKEADFTPQLRLQGLTGKSPSASDGV